MNADKPGNNKRGWILFGVCQLIGIPSAIGCNFHSAPFKCFLAWLALPGLFCFAASIAVPMAVLLALMMNAAVWWLVLKPRPVPTG